MELAFFRPKYKTPFPPANRLSTKVDIIGSGKSVVTSPPLVDRAAVRAHSPAV